MFYQAITSISLIGLGLKTQFGVDVRFHFGLFVHETLVLTTDTYTLAVAKASFFLLVSVISTHECTTFKDGFQSASF